MHTFKNLSKDTPMGVNTKSGLTVYVQPGQTSGPLDVADDELTFHKRAKLFDVASASAAKDEHGELPKGPEDGTKENSSAHREGNVDEAGNPVPPGGGQAVLTDDEFDAMTDEQLRAYITDRDGRAPHPNTGREKLLAAAKPKAEEAV